MRENNLKINGLNLQDVRRGNSEMPETKREETINLEAVIKN